jgi:hypothetical protein
MKIESKDFRVREGDRVKLEKWPTKVDPVYKSKEQYKSLLEEHVAKLSSITPPTVLAGRWLHRRALSFIAPADAFRIESALRSVRGFSPWFLARGETQRTMPQP